MNKKKKKKKNKKTKQKEKNHAALNFLWAVGTREFVVLAPITL